MTFLRNIFIVFLLFPHLALSAQITHAEVRKIFPKAVKEEQTCVSLINQLQDIQKNDYILLAYRGAATIVMAKYSSSPNQKLNHFTGGKKELEKSIEKMPNNVELRFLRFTIQENTPSMLFYDDQDEDIVFIIEHLSDMKDENYKQRIKEFLRESGECSEEQLTALNQ